MSATTTQPEFRTMDSMSTGFIRDGLFEYPVYELGDEYLVHHTMDGKLFIWRADTPEGEPRITLPQKIAAMVTKRGDNPKTWTKIDEAEPFLPLLFEILHLVESTSEMSYRAGVEYGREQGRYQLKRETLKALGVWDEMQALGQRVEELENKV